MEILIGMNPLHTELERFAAAKAVSKVMRTSEAPEAAKVDPEVRNCAAQEMPPVTPEPPAWLMMKPIRYPANGTCKVEFPDPETLR